MSNSQPLSNEKESQKSDSDRLIKSEVESLNNRLRKSNKESDDLCDRLSHVKRKLERREREFEVERIRLYRRIDELEAQRLELIDKVSRYSVDGLMRDEDMRSRLDETERKLRDAEEREKNFKEQLDIVKRSLKDKDNVKKESEVQKERTRQLQEMVDTLSLENAKLREDLAQSSRLLDQARRENNGLRQRTTDSVELEKDFQLQKQLILSVLDGETMKANKAAAEIEVVRETAHANEDAMRDELRRLNDLLQKKERLLENELKEKWRLQSEKDDQSRTFAQTEMELSNQVEELSTAMRENRRSSDGAESARNAELRAENDRLLSFVQTKDKRHQEAIVERDVEHALELRRLGEEWKTKMEDLEEKLRQKSLEVEMEKAVALSGKDKMTEALTLKTRETKDLNEELASCRSELDKLRKEVESLKRLEDKGGKLERALVRLKLENDELRSPTNENGVKDLLREKESHIVDLRREVLTLRETVKKYQTDGGPEIRGGAGDTRVTRDKYEEIFSTHRKLLDETTRLRTAYESGSGSPGLREQLNEAKRKLQASSARVSQLEHWLDEIYSDPEIIGPRTSRASKETGRSKVLSLPEVKGFVPTTTRQTTNRLSNTKGKLTTWKNGKRNV